MNTYVVREDSPLHSIADFDREGVRIAVGRGAAYDHYCRPTRPAGDVQRTATPTWMRYGSLPRSLKW
jgi:polar amino acid transport system substrate-binding protein